jgi:hypothetical protein
VDDCQERDGACHRRRAYAQWSFQRLQLAAFGAVEHLPAARTQALADCVGGREIAIVPERDAFGEQALRLFAVRSSPSWL